MFIILSSKFWGNLYVAVDSYYRAVNFNSLGISFLVFILRTD